MGLARHGLTKIKLTIPAGRKFTVIALVGGAQLVGAPAPLLLGSLIRLWGIMVYCGLTALRALSSGWTKKKVVSEGMQQLTASGDRPSFRLLRRRSSKPFGVPCLPSSVASHNISGALSISRPTTCTGTVLGRIQLVGAARWFYWCMAVVIY
jgi:hypothetical protein